MQQRCRLMLLRSEYFCSQRAVFVVVDASHRLCCQAVWFILTPWYSWRTAGTHKVKTMYDE